MRSASEPEISAGVMIANISWKQTTAMVGTPVAPNSEPPLEPVPKPWPMSCRAHWCRPPQKPLPLPSPEPTLPNDTDQP